MSEILTSHPPESPEAASDAFDRIVSRETDGGRRVTPDELSGEILRGANRLSPVEARKLEQIVVDVRSALHDITYVGVLPDSIAGEYDPRAKTTTVDAMAVLTFDPEQGVSSEITLDQVADHERYHQEHQHGTAMTGGVSAEGDTVVVIAGTKLTATEIDETVTVHHTGYVPAYEGIVAKTTQAIAAAGISINELTVAANNRDVSKLDDAA